MKQWKWTAAVAAASVVALTGCASTGKGGAESIVQVKVDNVKRVTDIAFAPQPMDCARVAHCPTLGVAWSSETPNRATLLIGTYGASAKVTSIEFNARPYAPLRVRSLAKVPSQLPGVTAFVVPMDTIERVAFGKSAWVKLSTDTGVIEETMYSGEASSPAADALKRFVYETYKASDKEIPGGLLNMFTDKTYAPNYDK